MEANPKVWGVDESTLLNVADEFGLDLKNFRRIGRSFAFRIGVKPGTPRRRSAGFGGKRGRVVQSPTFPRMALFILAMFDKGASRVQSAMGNWRSPDEFLYDLGNIRDKNIGSQMYPAYLGDRELNEADPKMEEAFEKIWGGY